MADPIVRVRDLRYRYPGTDQDVLRIPFLDVTGSGLIALTDSETGQPLLIDTGDARVRERYAALARERRDKLYANFRRLGIDAFDVRTTEPVTGPLTAYLRAKERRRYR